MSDSKKKTELTAEELIQVARDWIETINETDEGEFRKALRFLYKFKMVDPQIHEISERLWHRLWVDWRKNVQSSDNYYLIYIKNKVVKDVIRFPTINDAYDYIDYRFSNIVGTNKGSILARFYESIGAGADRKINKNLDCLPNHAWFINDMDKIEYDWIIVKSNRNIPMYNFARI